MSGLSQRALADKLNLLGVNLYNSDISLIEQHRLFIRDYELYAICKILNITQDKLYEDADKFYNN